MVSLAVRDALPPARGPPEEDLAPPFVARLEVEVRGLWRSVDPRFLFEPIRGVPVFGVLLPLDGVRVEGFELRRLLVRVLVAVFRVPEDEGIRRELVLDDGMRLVFEPDLVGTRRYGMRVEGFELRRLSVRVLVAVFRVPEDEGIRRELVLDDGMRLVFEPDLVGTRRYMSRRDVLLLLVLRVTGLIV